MKIDGYIKRYGLRGRAIAKARSLAETDPSAAIDYCKGKRTLPQAVKEDVKPKQKYVDQIIVHKDFPSESISAKDIYFMAFPSRAVEYLHCTKKRRLAIGVLAQHWTNARIDPKSGSCRCHFIVATMKKGHQTAGAKPRHLRFVPFGGAFTKTGHTKVFSWDSVKKQFAAEGIPLR